MGLLTIKKIRRNRIIIIIIVKGLKKKTPKEKI